MTLTADIWRLLHKHRATLGKILAAVVLQTAVALLFVFLVRKLVDERLFAAGGGVPSLGPLAVAYPLLLVPMYAVTALADFGVTLLALRWQQQFASDLRVEVFERITRARSVHLESVPSASHLPLIYQNVEQATTLLVGLIAGTGRDASSLVMMVGALLVLDYDLTITSFVIVPLVVIPGYLIARRSRVAIEALLDQHRRSQSFTSDALAGLSTIRFFGRETVLRTRFRHESEQLCDAANRYGLWSSAARPVTMLAAAIALAIVVLLSRDRVVNGELTSGTLVAFLTALMLFYRPVTRLADVMRQASSAKGAFLRLTEVVGWESENESGAAVPKAIERIEIDNVSYGYGDGPLVLRDVKLGLRAGERVGLVGPNGSGKSTLLRLIARHDAPRTGALRLNGVDVGGLALTEYRRMFGYLGQDAFVFNESVRFNLTLGVRVTEQHLIRVTQQFGAFEFISRLPEGFETVVGERGHVLSRGQLQRLCLCRAMLFDPPVLLLDEPRTALDGEGRAQFDRVLLEAMEGRTVLMATHHPDLPFDRLWHFVGDGTVREERAVTTSVRRAVEAQEI